MQRGRQAEARKTRKKKAEKDYSRAAGGKWLEDALLPEPELELEINRRLSSIGVRADYVLGLLEQHELDQIKI